MDTGLYTVRPENDGFRIYDPEGRAYAWLNREGDARAQAARLNAARGAKASAPPPPPPPQRQPQTHQERVDEAMDALWASAAARPAPPTPPPTPAGHTVRPANVGFQVLDAAGRPVGWDLTRSGAEALAAALPPGAPELSAGAQPGLTPRPAANPPRPAIPRPVQPAGAPAPGAAPSPAGPSANVPYATQQLASFLANQAQARAQAQGWGQVRNAAQAWAQQYQAQGQAQGQTGTAGPVGPPSPIAPIFAALRPANASPAAAAALGAFAQHYGAFFGGGGSGGGGGGSGGGGGGGTGIAAGGAGGSGGGARRAARRARAYVRLFRRRAQKVARRHGWSFGGFGMGAGGNVAAAAFAARAVGFGGSGMVGQAIGAAGRVGAAFEVAGPIGAAVVGAVELAKAFKDAVNSAHAFAEGVNASNRRLAPYSGVAALGMAQFEIGEVRRTMDLAARTAQGAAGLARQVDRMEDMWSDWRTGMASLTNERASAAAGFSGRFGKALSPAGRLLELAKDRLDPSGDMAAAAGGALADTLLTHVAMAAGGLPMAAAMFGWLKWGPDPKPGAVDIGPWPRFLKDAPTMGGAVHPRRLVTM